MNPFDESDDPELEEFELDFSTWQDDILDEMIEEEIEDFLNAKINF